MGARRRLQRLCCLLAALRPAAHADRVARDEPVALVQVAVDARRQPQGWPMPPGQQAMPLQPMQYYPAAPPMYLPQYAPGQFAPMQQWQPYPGMQQYPPMQPLPPQPPMPWGPPSMMPQPQPWQVPQPQPWQGALPPQAAMQQPQPPLRPMGAAGPAMAAQAPPQPPQPQAQDVPPAVAPAVVAPAAEVQVAGQPSAAAPSEAAASTSQQPAAEPEPKPEEQAPFYFQPDHGRSCIQGPQEYVTAALEKLKSSPIGGMYTAAEVKAGYCEDLLFMTWKTEECFPGAALFLDEMSGSRDILLAAEAAEARSYAARHGMKFEEVVGQLKELCQSPTAGLLPAAPAESNVQENPFAPKQPLHRLFPDNAMACVEGSAFYLATILRQLKGDKLLASAYANATVEEGNCVSVRYKRGPFANPCFPGASIFLPEEERHWWELAADRGLARRVSESEGITVEAALARLAQSCDDGSFGEGLYRQLRGLPPALQAVRVPPPVAHVVPDNGMACLQGTPQYIANTLKLIKNSPVYAHLFSKASQPSAGFCHSAGYTVGGGVGLLAGVGLVHSRCFPEARVFWDEDPEHLKLANEVEWGILGAETSEGFEDRIAQAGMLCGARHEVIFDRPIKALFLL